MRPAPAAIAAIALLGFAACAPKLEAPRESVRVSGIVQDVDPAEASASTSTPAAPASPANEPVKPAVAGAPTPAATPRFPVVHTQPLGVAIYEACSSQLYFFRRCPGKFLGEAKLAKPGPFVVEIDTQAPEIVVFGFRGFLGPDMQQEACDEATVPVADAAKPITLKLKSGTCSIKLERRYG